MKAAGSRDVVARVEIALCAFAAICHSAIADDVEVAVTNTPGHVLINSTSTTLVAGTAHGDGYPSSVASPQFWFDCSQTNGWTVSEFAGVKTVTKIPSLVGNRYLSTSTDGGYAGFTWAMSAPVFETGASPLGGAVLDFGVKGSKCAMVFDPVPVDGGTATNVLRDIGTVIAVWYSAVGDGSPSKAGDGAWGEGGYYGGAILGGGYGTDGNAAADKSGYVLYRQSANTRQLAAETGSYRPRWFDNPFANGSHTHYAIRNGVVRQDGQSTVPTSVGMSGGWEVLSLVPNTDRGLFNATGLGVNYSAVADVSGGFKVAEMLIYDTALTVEETALVEEYLNAKWFSRRSRGVNGNAQIGTVRASRNVSGDFHAFDQKVDVPSGEKLTIGKFVGGRGGGEAGILKTGDGALELAEVSKFCGAVKMSGGSLEFSQRPIPESLPHDPFLHFDPSSASSMVVDGEGEFVLLRNLAPNGVYKTNSICARPAAASFTPSIIHNALGDGLDIVDFGDYATTDAKRYLQLAADESAEISGVKAPIEGVTTIIALVGAHRGGGYISDGGRFLRYSSAPIRYDSWLLSNNPASLSATQHGVAFIDGLPANAASQGYPSAGYQVVAIQTAGSTVSRIGGYDVRSGGLRLGEFVAYKRVLSEDEIRDASAYLMKKWLKRRAPGYNRIEESTTPDVQKVLAVSDTVIDVAGGTARVGTLSSSGASVVKAGAGTLEIQKVATEELTVEGGGVAFVPAPDVAGVSQLADDPSLHLDVTAADTMEVVEVDGERRVLFWHSVNDRGVLATPPYAAVSEGNAYNADAYCPYLSSEVQLNGYDTLDFGPYTQAAGGRRMTLSKSFDSVRSAYVVWAPRDTNEGGRPLGNGKGTIDREGNSELYEFLRTGAGLVGSNATANHVRDGEIYTNGVAIAFDTPPMVDVFTLTEFHPAGGAHVSALGTDRDIDRFSGGVRIAEVVLYERELSEREKVATRNYLMAKWFNAEPQALPEKPASDNALTKFVVDGEGGMSVDVDVAVVKLQGSGTFEKKGAETLSVTDMSDFSGEVVVSNGVLRIAGRRPATTGALPTDGLLYHADATWGLTTVTNGDGTVEVTEWKSKLDDGWAAVPFYEGHNPTLVADRDLGGNKVVDMALGATALQSMRFVKDGEYALLDGISTVLWVIGSQNGGGYLLGGGTNYQDSAHVYNFMRHRADTTKMYYQASDAILNGEQYWTVPYNLRSAAWFKDGVSINPMSESLSGTWDLISMKITSASNPMTCADGFAFDGRTLTSATQMQSYMGGQRLAEVVIYNRALGDDELAAAEEYLRVKWGFNGTQSAPTNSVSVSLAAGAVLDLNATNQYLAAISGEGVVSNGVLAAGTIVADPTAATPTFDASASLAIEPGQRIVVANAASMEPGATVVVFEGNLVGAENLPSAVLEFEGEPCPGYVKARLKYEDGVLYVKFKPRGSLLLVR